MTGVSRSFKGQALLDTPRRQKAFLERNALGWEEGQRQYLRDWHELPRTRTVRDYPPQVDLELSSVCNLKCPMCFTLNDAFKSGVQPALMEFGLFTKVIDEIAGRVHKIHLSLRGEPTLNQDFIKCVAYAKRKGIGEVSTVTNGSRLDLDFFIAAAKAGMDRFSISIDGLEAEYNRIRAPLAFRDILQNIRQIHDYKMRHGMIKPVIKVQAVWPSIRANPTEFYRTLAPYVDLVSFNPLADWRHTDSNIEYEENFSCSTLYQRLVVGADGRIIMCINDEYGEVLLGDAQTQTIYEVWHSSQMAKIRQLHAEGQWGELGPCKRCLLPRKTEMSETALVEGREIVIENYTNRPQTL